MEAELLLNFLIAGWASLVFLPLGASIAEKMATGPGTVVKVVEEGRIEDQLGVHVSNVGDMGISLVIAEVDPQEGVATEVPGEGEVDPIRHIVAVVEVAVGAGVEAEVGVEAEEAEVEVGVDHAHTHAHNLPHIREPEASLLTGGKDLLPTINRPQNGLIKIERATQVLQLRPRRDGAEVEVEVAVKAEVAVVRRNKQVEVAVPVVLEKMHLIQQMQTKRLPERRSHLIPPVKRTARTEVEVKVRVAAEVAVGAEVPLEEVVKVPEQV